MSMLDGIKVVVFDIDDTLISEDEYNLSGFKVIAQEISKKYNVNKSDIYNKQVELYKNKSNYIFNKTLDFYNLKYSDDYILQLLDKFRNHVPNITLYDDFMPFYEKIKVRGLKTAIITDGYKETQRNKIKVLRLDALIDYIIVTDEIGRDYWKPHPRPFDMIKKYFKINYNEMVYIGDNPNKDFYISSIYPIKTIRINRGGIYKDYNYYKNIKPDFLIKNFSNIQ